MSVRDDSQRRKKTKISRSYAKSMKEKTENGKWKDKIHFKREFSKEKLFEMKIQGRNFLR